MYIIFADGMKMYREINYPETGIYYSLNINSVEGWCIVNYVKLSISETKVIFFSRNV
jgi:hypothetical protein